MNSVFIIAEAGVNHNGDVGIAKRLISAAQQAGADAVKFQTFTTEKIVIKNAPRAEYQRRNMPGPSSQFNMLKKLELDQKAHKELLDLCKKKDITFISSPFDHGSINLLNDLGLDIFKIPSGEITNLPYLRHIGSLKKRIILSTGMSTLGEVETALEILVSSGTARDNITLLHANTMYPTPMEDVNLKAMETLAKAFQCDVGYSDHTPGIEVAIAAAAIGAKVIEKHFTLDRNMEGPDHKASLEPPELKAMVKAIRNIERALGTGLKKPTPSEMPNRDIARKSIVATKPIRKGEMFTEHNLTAKRPGTGLSPMRWDELIGSVAMKDYQPDELI